MQDYYVTFYHESDLETPVSKVLVKATDEIWARHIGEGLASQMSMTTPKQYLFDVEHVD